MNKQQLNFTKDHFTPLIGQWGSHKDKNNKIYFNDTWSFIFKNLYESINSKNIYSLNMFSKMAMYYINDFVDYSVVFSEDHTIILEDISYLMKRVYFDNKKHPLITDTINLIIRVFITKVPEVMTESFLFYDTIGLVAVDFSNINVDIIEYCYSKGIDIRSNYSEEYPSLVEEYLSKLLEEDIRCNQESVIRHVKYLMPYYIGPVLKKNIENYATKLNFEALNSLV